MDLSKMDPKVLMQLSELVRQLPPERLQRMQTLMHNAMAGFDVRKDMEEFERELPPGFREKIIALMGNQPMGFGDAPPVEVEAEMQPSTTAGELGLRDARLTILRGVASGQVSPEEAEKLLFNAG